MIRSRNGNRIVFCIVGRAIVNIRKKKLLLKQYNLTNPQRTSVQQPLYIRQGVFASQMPNMELYKNKCSIVFDTNLAMHTSTVVTARVRRWFRRKLSVFQR